MGRGRKREMTALKQLTSPQEFSADPALGNDYSVASELLLTIIDYMDGSQEFILQDF